LDWSHLVDLPSAMTAHGLSGFNVSPPVLQQASSKNRTRPHAHLLKGIKR
jgi:hypothetical protein